MQKLLHTRPNPLLERQLACCMLRIIEVLDAALLGFFRRRPEFHGFAGDHVSLLFDVSEANCDQFCYPR